MSGTDATVMVAGPLLDIVDDEWRADTLPEDGESTVIHLIPHTKKQKKLPPPDLLTFP
jgi:hypothetical protein